MAKQSKEARIIKSLKGKSFEPKTPIATDMFIPNSSGVESFSKLKKIIRWFCEKLFVDHIAERTSGHGVTVDNNIVVKNTDVASVTVWETTNDVAGGLYISTTEMGIGSTTNHDFYIFVNENVEVARFDTSGNLHITGDLYTGSLLKILEGIRLKYEPAGTNYITFTVESDGDLTIDSNKASYNLDFGDGNLITTGNISGTNIIAATGTFSTSVTIDGNLGITGKGTFGEIDVDNITINGATITSNTGAISLDNEHLTTTGDITCDQLTITNQSRCKVERSGGQSIPSLVTTIIQFENVLWDGQSEWDAVNYRFVAKTAGYYLVTSTVQMNNVAAGKQVQVSIYMNGAEKARTWIWYHASGKAEMPATTILYLAVNDYVDTRVQHNDIVARTTGVAFRNHMDIHRLS